MILQVSRWDPLKDMLGVMLGFAKMVEAAPDLPDNCYLFIGGGPEKELFKQLQAQRDAAWGEVARRLAHEIKNPLGGIRGAAQLLESEISNPEFKEYTEVIIREADRLGIAHYVFDHESAEDAKRPRVVVERCQLRVAHHQVGIALEVGRLDRECLFLGSISELVHPHARRVGRAPRAADC